jgi:hypothetical protein
MSDTTVPGGARGDASGEDPDGLTPAQLQPKDWALELLVNMTVDLGTSAENSIGLTVTVGGMLVSGMVIHREKWAELLVAQMRAAGGTGNAEVIAAALSTAIGGRHAAATAMQERRDQSSLPAPVRRFLHFRDARVYTPDHWQELPLYRVAIEDVSGWALGSHAVTGD